MSDDIALVVREDAVAPFVLREVPQGDIILGTTISLTGPASLVGPSGPIGPQLKGISLFCSGNPLNDELIGGGIAPYNFTINELNCTAKAKIASSSIIVFTIKNNDVIIGTVTFAIGAFEGTVDIITPDVLAGSYVTIHTPSTTDSTLSDIGIIIRE